MFTCQLRYHSRIYQRYHVSIVYMHPSDLLCVGWCHVTCVTCLGVLMCVFVVVLLSCCCILCKRAGCEFCLICDACRFQVWQCLCFVMQRLNVCVKYATNCNASDLFCIVCNVCCRLQQVIIWWRYTLELLLLQLVYCLLRERHFKLSLHKCSVSEGRVRFGSIDTQYVMNLVMVLCSLVYMGLLMDL